MYFRSFCGIVSTCNFFFSLINSRLQELKNLVEKELQPQKAWLCLSLEVSVLVVETISDQIKGSTDKLLLACISSFLCVVHSLSSQSFAAQ